MERIPRGRYSKEFRIEAVKLVTEDHLSLPEVGRRLNVAPSTIGNWVKAHKAGRLTDIGKSQRPLTELEMELYRIKRELAEVKMERDILKKAAAYFAKESLPGTR
jgi:transposase